MNFLPCSDVCLSLSSQDIRRLLEEQEERSSLLQARVRELQAEGASKQMRSMFFKPMCVSFLLLASRSHEVSFCAGSFATFWRAGAVLEAAE